MQLTFEIEDGLAEIVESPGAMATIQAAIHRTILDLKQSYWERASRPQGAGSFRGTEKS
jgi:hypothetical protein